NGMSMVEIENIIEKEKEKTAGYNEYVKWLESQDKVEGLKYWKELLLEYEEPAEIKATKRSDSTYALMDRIKISLEKEF
ncbi:hypothetical protein, partial [Bacillus thuringiensis]|uniref:hypothetical protein n=1 Tax=Bacillus thuringiensis TaxID=1428 RepID=UPI002FBECE7E